MREKQSAKGEAAAAAASGDGDDRGDITRSAAPVETHKSWSMAEQREAAVGGSGKGGRCGRREGVFGEGRGEAMGDRHTEAGLASLVAAKAAAREVMGAQPLLLLMLLLLFAAEEGERGGWCEGGVGERGVCLEGERGGCVGERGASGGSVRVLGRANGRRRGVESAVWECGCAVCPGTAWAVRGRECAV